MLNAFSRGRKSVEICLHYFQVCVIALYRHVLIPSNRNSMPKVVIKHGKALRHCVQCATSGTVARSVRNHLVYLRSRCYSRQYRNDQQGLWNFGGTYNLLHGKLKQTRYGDLRPPERITYDPGSCVLPRIECSLHEDCMENKAIQGQLLANLQCYTQPKHSRLYHQ